MALQIGPVDPFSDVGGRGRRLFPGTTPSGQYAVTEFGAYSNTVPGAVRTYGKRLQVPFNFYGGRVVQYNQGTTLPAANNMQFGVAAVPDLTTVASALAAVTWRGATSAGGGGVFTGSPATMLEAALSDPFFLTALPRTDGGAGYLIELRCVVSTSGITYSLRPSPTNGQQYQQIDHTDFNADLAGDFVTTNPAGFSAATVTPAGNLALGDLILFSDANVWNVASGGDSLEYGQFGLRGNMNEWRIACEALTLARVGNFNFAGSCWPAGTAAQYGYRTADYVRKIRPQILSYTVTSPNGGTPTTAGFLEAAKQRLAYVAQACSDVNCQLVISTQPVWNINNTANDAALLAFNAQIRTMADNMGALFYDRYALTSNGATPSQLKAGYAWGTGTAQEATHLNATAYSALAAPAADILRSLTGL